MQMGTLEQRRDLTSGEAKLSLIEKIGVGNDREVWRHPYRHTWGVKVAKPQHGREQNAIDLHYSMHLEHLGIVSHHLPRAHGLVETDRGTGLVIDLVLQPDGTTCPSLAQALRRGLVSELEAIGLVHEACGWLERSGVMLADYGVHNFLVRFPSDSERPHLVFIDGLGTRHLDFKYWARCTFTALERWTARQKAHAFRDKTLSLINDRSSKLWHSKKSLHIPLGRSEGAACMTEQR
ncbi:MULTISPECIES: YrbL family protein [unclassified Achromobacter]|uniref:YrbL family protein n=1 Tax=unclassified Achromobacter TaxID=2626865 RepID=UPI000B51B91B|nr:MULTISPECIES: YrbL family protein [unclassified Achromobacter]OWT80291.1 hypothetical protein CEY05_02435 [Achromobacter sp. HZ34]OWT82174.1 hypothetical protein CEY04_02435 [Achromobacter sp. HZ28]